MERVWVGEFIQNGKKIKKKKEKVVLMDERMVGGGGVSRNREGWQNKLKKRNTLTAPEKLLQSEDTSEKNILLYKMKNKM